MMNAHPQTVRTLAMAAGLAAGHATVAFAAGEPAATPAAAPQASAAVKKALDQATELLSLSKVVKAKELLGSIRSDSSVSMTGAESTRYQELVRQVAARERSLDRNELSLQKAEWSLEAGELKLAEQHARSVATATGVSPVSQKQAEKLLATIAGKRQDATLAAPGSIRAAANAFDMGKYAEAKAILEMVAKAGVDLPPAEASILEDYRGRVLALAEQDATLFARPAAGMIQPGEIQPRNPEAEPAGEKPAVVAQAQPEAAPAAQPEKPADDAIAAARRNEAARELARANKLFEDKKYGEALTVYQNVRTAYGDVLSAEQSAQLSANVAAGQQAMAAAAQQPGGGALSAFQQNKSVAKQQTLAEFNNYMMEAKKALDQSNIELARQLAAKAELRIAEKKALFGEPELADLKNRVDLLQADIAKAGDALAAKNAAAITERLQKDAADRQAGEQAAKAAKIREHIDRVRNLQRERKYEEALQVCDQILFIDPMNPSGLLLRDVLSDMKMFRDMNMVDLERSRKMNELSLDNANALIPPTQTVQYPKDWPNISNLRSEALAFQDTVDNRRVIAALESTRIPKAELADTPFEAALKYLQTFANVNMDIDWPSLEAIGVQKDATVSLSLTNPTVQTVMETVLAKVSPSADAADMNRAGWTVYDGVLHVGSEAALRKNKVMVIYDVQDLLFEVRDKTDIPELDLQASFQNGGGGRGGGGGSSQSPFGGSGGRGQQQRQPGQGLQRPFEDRLRDLRNIIVAQVDPQGWQDNSGDTGTIQVFQQNLIITNTPKNHRAIEGLLSQLRRVRNMQINVEARFLVVSSDFFEKIGFDIDVYLNAHGNQVRFLRNQGNYAFMPSEFFPDGRYAGNNVGSTNKTVDTDNDGIPDSPPLNNGPAAPPPENFSVIGLTNGSLGLTSRLMTSSFASEVTGSGTAPPALGISGTFLDDVQVDFLLEATQADRRSVSLNAPRLTFTNGQTANVFVARQLAYISDLTPQVADNSVAWDPQTAFVNDGVTLLVSGVILADRRYVQLDVETRVSNYPDDRIRRIPVSAAAGGTGGVGGGGAAATATAFIELPQGQIQSVSTTVTVPDMGTVLLGGQRVTSETEVESGVPVLSKIPIINRFFSNRSMSREERTLLMLIRPQILIQDETEDKFFPGLREALRTGGFDR